MSRLIIKNADFSAQKVTTLSNDVVLKKYGIFTANDNSLRYYNNVGQSYIDNAGSVPYPTATEKECIIIYDVEDFVGKEINIKACHLYVSSNYTMAAFASSIQEDVLSSFAESAKTATEAVLPGPTILESVERFNISSANNKITTIQKIVPAGSKYLVFTNASAILPNAEVTVWQYSK